MAKYTYWKLVDKKFTRKNPPTLHQLSRRKHEICDQIKMLTLDLIVIQNDITLKENKII